MMHVVKRNGESELEQKLLTPAGWDNAIKTDIFVVVTSSKKKYVLITFQTQIGEI